MRVLITGSNGFVGKPLRHFLKNNNLDVINLVRNSSHSNVENQIILKNFYCEESWLEVLINIDVVIHLVAVTHNQIDEGKSMAEVFKEVNVGITKILCKAIKKSSVKRLIYLSSIKANGETTMPGCSFSELSPTIPEDQAGVTKLEAEKTIKNLFNNTNKEYVILRLPLLYGKNLKGNLKLFERLIEKGIPLPFGGIRNSRSILSIDNLCYFLLSSLRGEITKNKLFLLCDEEQYSTVDLVNKIAIDKNLSSKIFYFPPSLLKLFFFIIGKNDLSKKLLSNLNIDNKASLTILERAQREKL
jgi:UDP-glucose 4-epimerase